MRLCVGVSLDLSNRMTNQRFHIFLPSDPRFFFRFFRTRRPLLLRPKVYSRANSPTPSRDQYRLLGSSFFPFESFQFIWFCWSNHAAKSPIESFRPFGTLDTSQLASPTNRHILSFRIFPSLQLTLDIYVDIFQYYVIRQYPDGGNIKNMAETTRTRKENLWNYVCETSLFVHDCAVWIFAPFFVSKKYSFLIQLYIQFISCFFMVFNSNSMPLLRGHMSCLLSRKIYKVLAKSIRRPDFSN